MSKNWKKAKAEVERIHARIANVVLTSCIRLLPPSAKPRDGCDGEFRGAQYVPICRRHCRTTRQERQAENRTQQVHPRPEVGRLSPANEIQDDLDWRPVRPGSTTKHQHCLSSTACPGCGPISKENRKKQAQFACVECGFSENVDFVGVINIPRKHRIGEIPNNCKWLRIQVGAALAGVQLLFLG